MSARYTEGARAREGSERGRHGIDAEGGERYPEPDGDKTRMPTLLDCDFSGIARQIAMPSCFSALLEMLLGMQFREQST